MRLQPNRDYTSNDNIQTPPELARRLVAHFQPTGRILEPCAGDGNFLRALRAHARSINASAHGSNAHSLISQLSATNSLRASHVYSCELKRGADFFAWEKPVDWIVTNPPWSQLRRFLQHALAHADQVVFLCTINHLWTRARLRDMASAGFGLREIVMMDTPANFPPMGFQLGAVHLSRGWTGPITLTDWNEPVSSVDGGVRSAPGRLAAEKRSTVRPSTVRNVQPSPSRNARLSTVHRARPALPSTDLTLEELRAFNRHLDSLLAEAPKP